MELRPVMTRRHRRKQSADYFCQVRFLWRFARSFLLRLCLLIFALRRFLSEPIGFRERSIYDFIQRIFNDSFGPGSLELRNQFTDDVFINDRLHGHPALLAEAGNSRPPQGGQAG